MQSIHHSSCEDVPEFHYLVGRSETMIRAREDVSDIRQAAAPQERYEGERPGAKSTPSGFSSIIGSYL